MTPNPQANLQGGKGFFSDCCFLEIPEKSIRAIWEVTHYCPFDCRYCFTSSGPGIPLQEDYFRDNYATIIGRLRDLGVRDVLVTGGEPLTLGETIVSAMARIKSAGMTFSVSTTAYELDRFKAVLEVGPQMVNLSFDPGLMGTKMKSSVDDVKKRIALCRDANVSVKLSGVIMPGERMKVEAYLDALPGILKEFPNIRKVALKDRYALGRFAREPRLNSAELGAYAKLFRSTKAMSGLQKFALVNWPQLHAPLQKCPAGKSIMAVLPTGDYAACSLLFYSSDSFRLGNLIDDPVPVIRGKLAAFNKRWERRSAKVKRTDKLCSSCKASTTCGTGCPALLPVSDETKAVPLCRIHAFPLSGDD
jgi:radical SAM protein with 4Fe4S-binding SPASM domain